MAGHAIETRNHADIVSQSADGTWYVDDIKLLLASHNESIHDRYKLQTAFYAWLLERQLEDETVQGYVTCLGESTDSSVANPPFGTIPSWLERFG
jgi:ATP-dependent helicase/nuclease subunit A